MVNPVNFKIVISVMAVTVLGAVLFQYSQTQRGSLQHIEGTKFRDVWLVPDAEADDIRVHFILNRGEMDNPFAEGMAHYVEHLAWLNAFEGDSSSRHSNAWTNISATGYWQTTTQEEFSNSVGRLLQIVDPLQLDTEFMLEEREIVQREYDLSVSEGPLYPVHQAMDAIMYNNGPLARSVFGSYREIGQFSLHDARDLHADTHVLQNFTLFVTGNVSAAKVREAIAHVTHGEESRPRAQQQLDATAFRDERALIVPGLKRELLIYRKIVRLEDCDFSPRCNLALSTLHSSLVSTLPGGLAGPLRFDNFIAAHFSLSLFRPDDKHLEIRFTASPDRGVSLDTLLSSFEATLAETIENGLPQKTFQRSKEGLVQEVEFGEDDPDYLSGMVLDLINSDWPVYDWKDEVRAVKKISEDDIAAILRQMAQPGRVAIRKALPEDE